MVVLTAAVWQSHSKQCGVGTRSDWETRRGTRILDKTRSSWAAQPKAQWLTKSQQQVIQSLGSNKANFITTSEDALIVQRVLHRLTISTTQPMQLWPWPQISIPLPFLPPMVLFCSWLKLPLSQVLLQMWLSYIFMYSCSEMHPIWFPTLHQ